MPRALTLHQHTVGRLAAKSGQGHYAAGEAAWGRVRQGCCCSLAHSPTGVLAAQSGHVWAFGCGCA